MKGGRGIAHHLGVKQSTRSGVGDIGRRKIYWHVFEKLIGANGRTSRSSKISGKDRDERSYSVPRTPNQLWIRTWCPSLSPRHRLARLDTCLRLCMSVCVCVCLCIAFYVSVSIKIRTHSQHTNTKPRRTHTCTGTLTEHVSPVLSWIAERILHIIRVRLFQRRHVPRKPGPAEPD